VATNFVRPDELAVNTLTVKTGKFYFQYFGCDIYMQDLDFNMTIFVHKLNLNKDNHVRGVFVKFVDK